MKRSWNSAASLAALLDLFSVRCDNPELVQAQIEALSKQIPLLLVICLVNAWALAGTHYNVAPNLLVVSYPVLITVGYCVPGWTWIAASYRPPSHEKACKQLKLAVLQAPVATAFNIGWALALYQYGNAYTQGHVIFTIGITVTSCVFCQMHLRPAVLLVAITTAIAFVGLTIGTGSPIFMIVALSMLLALIAMVYIALIFWRDFTNKIASRQALAVSQLENARLANIDALTSLPNRRQFFSRLQELLRAPDQGKKSFLVGLVDLDGFKSVNDLCGHTAGDRLLVEAGRRLQALCDATTFFARLGGDEFGVIVEAKLSDLEIQAFGARICTAMEIPFDLPGDAIAVSSSVGLAIHPEAGSTAEQLYESADYALYRAKEHQRGRAVVFSRDHASEIREQANLERCLHEADFEAELSLCFQPLYDITRGRVVAFEALARWNSPKVGRVRPDLFIRIAERNNLINKITPVLLRKALAAARSWPAHIGLAFNLSARDLTSREAVAKIVAIIETGGVAASRIDLEVTETALMQDVQQASESLRWLKSTGVRVAMDDFGTGYSSLSYIRQFPIDKIKIDRSFVMDIDSQPSCRAIVKSVVDLCQNLRLSCVVEGIEAQAQVEILQELGCAIFQGYLFGKPMPEAETANYLDSLQPQALSA